MLVGCVDYPWPIGMGTGINTSNREHQLHRPARVVPIRRPDGRARSRSAPWGYGAWGTISVGELFLIKKNGGGLIVYGDIDAITSAISMPGVQSVGDFVGRASAGPLPVWSTAPGAARAWVWNGGNTSQKISTQLRDSFYDATTATGMVGNNYGFDVTHWQNWIVFSNNYLYDLDHGGWWQLYPGDGGGNASVTGHTFWWWNEGRFGNQMYAAPLKFASGAKWWYKFDSEVPAPHWQWQSLPIHVDANADRTIDLREIYVRAL